MSKAQQQVLLTEASDTRFISCRGRCSSVKSKRKVAEPAMACSMKGVRRQKTFSGRAADFPKIIKVDSHPEKS
jgi:hypothetical protein